MTGPTGSGKSTTLYATLNIAQQPDAQHHHGRGPGRVPAARHQPGADQPQGRPDVRRRRCARSCAPTPTSCSSVRSATTRPRRSPSRPPSPVTSCSRPLHTNDAPSAITRLDRDGHRAVPRRLPRVDCVLAQRLARRLCAKCKEPYPPTAEALALARFPLARRRAAADAVPRRSAAPRAPRPATRAGSPCTRSCSSPRRSSG